MLSNFIGGIITREDFRAYKSIIRNDEDVIQTHLAGGRHICGPPPPSGSAVSQAILNILDGYFLITMFTHVLCF